MQKNTPKKPAQHITERAFLNNPGDFLLSHTVTRAVPSAPTGLTSVFGMGTGVTLSTKSPENLNQSLVLGLWPSPSQPLKVTKTKIKDPSPKTQKIEYDC